MAREDTFGVASAATEQRENGESHLHTSPQGRMRFLTKSGLGASRLAALPVQEAGTGRRLRLAAKARGGAHLPAGEAPRKILPVALPLPPARPLREEQ